MLKTKSDEEKLKQFSYLIFQVKFIVLELGMLVVFLIGVYAVVAHELGFR